MPRQGDVRKPGSPNPDTLSLFHKIPFRRAGRRSIDSGDPPLEIHSCVLPGQRTSLAC